MSTKTTLRGIMILLFLCTGYAFGMSGDGAVIQKAYAAETEIPLGEGTKESPYQIGTAEELKWFADCVNSSTNQSTSALCAQLTKDIELGGQEWTPIGYYDSYSKCVYYGGTFDGCGKTISGLAIHSDKQYRALFGYLKGAVVKNLTVKGVVEVSPTSSSYAAGIVAYGSPVTISNCINDVNVISTTKGYVGGIAAATYSGSSITGCVNNGMIKAYGDFAGGIVGTATGGTEIRNCFNNGSIENTGKPSSYAYSTGGIAGGISGSSTAVSSIVMCGNTGDVTSSLKRTGGIVGSLGGEVEKCFNTGDIAGTYGVGGIAGDSAYNASTVVSCYNTGIVTGNTPAAEFSDSNTKGIGGIIGGVASNTYKAFLSGCYNAGNVILSTELTDVLSGGIVGDSSGKNYSGVETTGLVTADNCYYLNSSAVKGDGRNEAMAGITAKTGEKMSDSGFPALLGEDYISDTNGGYPLLGWQDPDAKYIVHFGIEPSGAVLIVRDADGKKVEPDSGNTYLLENGTYSYTVSGEECEDAVGSFTVAYGGQTVTVSLQVKTYDFVFETEPEDADLKVEGQMPLADGRTYRFARMGNPYSYKVDAYGYEAWEGAVEVTGNADIDRCKITLKKKPLYAVTIPYEKESGGVDGDVNIQVSCTGYPAAQISPEEDGTFNLPDGQYTYSIFSAGYKTVKGEFTVKGENLILPQVKLQIQTSWDGETVTEPGKNSEGIYQITGPGEFMWFMKNALLTASAELTTDIRINETVSEDTGAPYSWQPVGASSSKAYTGDFNGNGHTISGIYVDGKNASNGGLFGYVGTGGSIHDLILKDSVITGNGSYYGGIVGDLKGEVTNCHVADTVSVTGKAYVGGIVGELDTGGKVSACSNAGSVKDTGTNTGGNTGGIAGRVYSSLSNALTDCVNTGTVSGYRYVGGIAGTVYMGGTLCNVYSTGTVTATDTAAGTAGGLAGNLRAGKIQNAYAAAAVSAVHKGGVLGYLESTQGKTLDQVYYLSDIADEAVGNENGCTVQGTAQICTSDELKNMAEALGDGFVENDSEMNGGYPLLGWQAGRTVTDENAPIPDEDGWNGKTASIAPEQKEGVYQIATPAELKWFAKAAGNTPDIKGILTADLNLNHRPWTMIGGQTSDTAFCGSFDGNGHIIENLYIGTGSSAGLFGYNAGEIKNLTVSGKVCSADGLAGIAGYNSGTISNVTAEVILSGGNHIAGIAAYNEKTGMIADCFSSGSIEGGQYVAGITSFNKGTVKGCGNNAAITAASTFVAGVAADNSGTVEGCANSGQIIGKAAVQYAYVGGVVGRNDGTSKKLYNSGNVVSLGSCTGGCVAINTSGSAAQGLYNVGDVCGSYIDTEEGEDFRVGGAIGEVVNGVSDAYTLKSLTIQCGGTLVTAEEIAGKAGELAGMLPAKSMIDGTVSLGNLQVGDMVKAQYAGTARYPVFVWYVSDGVDETVLSVSEDYEIPAGMTGRVLRVKVMEPSFGGILSGQSEKIDGFTGSVQISGYAVVGHTLTAVYQGGETAPVYQWYRGTNAISGENKASYIITEADLGASLSVRVTGQKPGYAERKTGIVQSGEAAGIWPVKQTEEPVKIAGVYVITNEKELKWFVNCVNSGTTYIDGKLAEDIVLTAENWYSIGSVKNPYTGTFDGNGKTVSGLKLNTSRNEQGFFGNIGGKGEVKRLSVSGEITVNADSVGGIAGYIEGKVTGCSFAGTISGKDDVGGIAGQSGLNSNISQCMNKSTVQGSQNVGGIAGSVSYGTVSECVNNGTVGKEGVTVNAGGIAGYMTNYAVITACWNKGSISGKSKLGGIAGEASVCAAPQGCYNIGKVGPGFYAYGVLGGLSGTDYISGTQGSFYLAESQAEATDKTAQGVSSAGMKKESFVTLLNAQAGKTLFVADEKNENDGYPLLLWQTGGEGSGSETEDPDKPEILNVTFTLCGDTVHGADGTHIAYEDWIETTACTMSRGDTAYDLFKKMLNDYEFDYEVNGNSYVSSVTGPDGVKLGEFSNGAFSGWMYTINDEFPDYMGETKLKDGDNMRFFYTDDYRETNWRPNDATVEAVEGLIDAIGTPITLGNRDKIETARDAYEMLNESQKWNVSNYDDLVAAEKELAVLEKPYIEITSAVNATADYMLSLGTPQVGSVGGEWMVLGLARSGREIADGYYKNAVQYIEQKIDADSRLHEIKSTENSRMILALTAAGYDASDVAGYNLLKGLTDLEYVKGQGINGAVWALIAFDSHNYKIPGDVGNSTTVTRENLVQTILDDQLSDGGWGLDGITTEPDMTAMALQALAPYYHKDENVKEAVDSALSCLSVMQLADGGYGNAYQLNRSCAESCAQVIVALTALGIDPCTDARFSKNGHSIMDALNSFFVEGGGFRHTAGGERNGMATEQGYYALVAYQRFIEGKTALYDMSDVTIRKTDKEIIHSHVWDDGKITKQAGCGESGIKIFTCKECGMERTVGIEATDKHEWDDGIIIKEATYMEEGSIRYTCKVCHETKDEPIAKAQAGQVKNLKVKSKGVTEMTLSWNGVKDATSYTIQQKTKKGKWKKAKVVRVKKKAEVTGTKAVVTDLKANTAYAFRIKVNIGDSSGSYSQATKFQKTKAAKKLKKPAAIPAGKLKAKAESADKILVTWSHVKDASGYQVRWSTDGKKWKSKTISAVQTSYSITKLKAGKKYYIQVAAKNKKGKGRYKKVTAKTMARH